MKKDIALSFSNGQFKKISRFLADDIQWYIYGENILIGKDAVKTHFDRVTAYFETVTTQFETEHVIESNDIIAVNGKAVFHKNGKEINVVNSCDIYQFNDQGLIRVVKSYCINSDI